MNTKREAVKTLATTTATIRATPDELALIDAAAERAELSRSQFIVRAALSVATADEHTANTAMQKPDRYQLQIDAINQRLEAVEAYQKHTPNSPMPGLYPLPAAEDVPQPRVNQILRAEAAEPAQAPTENAPEAPETPAAPAARYDLAAILAIIEKMRTEQIASGVKSNPAIARALHAAGLCDARGGEINASQITTFISRNLPHLLTPKQDV